MNRRSLMQMFGLASAAAVIPAVKAEAAPMSATEIMNRARHERMMAAQAEIDAQRQINERHSEFVSAATENLYKSHWHW